MQNNLNVLNSCTVVFENKKGEKKSNKFFFFTLEEFGDAFSRNILDQYQKIKNDYPMIEIQEIKIVDPLEQGIYEATLLFDLLPGNLYRRTETKKQEKLVFKDNKTINELISKINKFLRENLTKSNQNGDIYSLNHLCLKIR